VDEPGWNVTWLNAVLREALNRDGIKMPGTVFRLGDRIIVRQNMKSAAPAAEELRGRATQADLKQVQRAAGIETVLQSSEEESQRLVNGDTGFIVGWRQASETQIGLPAYVRLLLDDGRLVWLSGDDVAVLDHAYALTVHAVQGSEYRNVLVCMTPGSDGFINANMVLTAFSRAKGLLQVWGDEDVLKKAAATALPARNTALVQRVREQIQGFKQRQSLGEDKTAAVPQQDGAKLAKQRAREVIERSIGSGVVLTPKVVQALAQQHDLKATTLSFELSDMLSRGEVLPQHVWDVQQQGGLQEALPDVLDRLQGQEPRLRDLRDLLQQRLGAPVDYVQLRVALMVVRAQRQEQPNFGAEVCAPA
ncbi:MAG: ATP-dependent RecD-like DNA helicase, partial [Rhodocyclaceae bacterium]|nr:ATP-dependent RecD-like DNA helicase [Rhodocyclaceae bacterium]